MKQGNSPFLGKLFLLLAICFAVNGQLIAQVFLKSGPAGQQDSMRISAARSINATQVALLLTNGKQILLDFYGDNICRMFFDPAGGGWRDPASKPAAKILVDQPRKPLSALSLQENDREISIRTGKMELLIDKQSQVMKILDQHGKLIVQTQGSVVINKKQSLLSLKEYPDEYYYGGGVQNGRFSHKGNSIAIENQNSWTDGGVASPTPFYWSTRGYGFMWYTFQKGQYDFGKKQKGLVQLSHETNYLDVFFMADQEPVALLNDFYQLTGHPVLLPQFAFYEGHLNAYNRDYWKQDSSGILFEDGKRYKESQKDNGGIKESLNGEKNNYMFSARAVIDRYQAYDLPLGWILPNDGYGAGYGQTGTLDSNILNLQSLGDYARKHGVQIGLWTQSDLHPKEGVSALLQRDIEKEVAVAGVRVLKTDVAWVGPGYSFGLNGVADVASIMPRYGNNARPFIISLDGWAGTQRFASVWTGDQTGGQWEYIRFHIPSYIGSGLSGQPNITSDMDGIFGGRNAIVNMRDFEWKAFTPLQLNMDGWGSNEKYPYALGEPATSVNRLYLKWKSALLPYTYSIAHEAINGMPMMRAMFLEKSNSYTLGRATQYQYLYGPYFLVAPVYHDSQADSNGNDIRNGIYLPEGKWIDYFTGTVYEGGCIINNYEAPYWKLPLFVKSGAIIPMTNPNNHVSDIDRHLRMYELYPDNSSSFSTYEDDGLTEAYKDGKSVSTLIESVVNDHKVTVTIHPAKGDYNGFEKDKRTEFCINLSRPPSQLKARVGNRKIKLKQVHSMEAFTARSNVYYYNAAPNLNQFATKGSAFGKMVITKNPQLLVKISATDVTKNTVALTVKGFYFEPENSLQTRTGVLAAPTGAQVLDSNRQAFALRPSWNRVANADYYEIAFNGERYTLIRDTSLLFEDLSAATDYSFRLRAVNKDGHSDWTTIAATTMPNPLQYAIRGIRASATMSAQEGSELTQLFDFDESNMWHTRWSAKAVPFDLVIDLMSVNQLDKLQYLPRSRGNGIWKKGTIYYSLDKQHWDEAGHIEWTGNGERKEFIFPEHPVARYIKINITEAVGDYGSGRELYVFKVPGTESQLPGDINNDHRIDQNDLTSYINYMGLRKGDSDFEGYISKGDINRNGHIDAYDISTVATQLQGGVPEENTDTLSGSLLILPNKKSCEKDELVEILVKGNKLKAVNALGFALPYSEKDFEFAGITMLHTGTLENVTNDRLHSNGEKVLYPTLVNLGDQPALEGSGDLFIIRMKAKHKLSVNFRPSQAVLVDQHLNSLQF